MARTAVVPVRFDPTERDRLKAYADEKGISISELVRHTALGLKLPDVIPKKKGRQVPKKLPEINRELFVELSRIGNNINQIARACNEARLKGYKPPVKEEYFRELVGALNNLSLAVIGNSDRED